ncbi:MAG: hypothetical protein GX447_02655 [Elusimicrobia bacterium]|nr:hypothetical protein [Elusimicrobiota bacterium]
MKYWLYSDGKIEGPFEPEELVIKPSFNSDSMVCEASLSGSSPDDWKRASFIPELSSFSVLTEKMPLKSVPSEDFSSQNYLSHPNILDTIENAVSGIDFLSGYAEENEKTDTFDLKISQIKEQLETAVWEKNLLIEKLNIKERRESEYKEKIKELEERVDELIKTSLNRAYEISGVSKEKEENKTAEKTETNISQKTDYRIKDTETGISQEKEKIKEVNLSEKETKKTDSEKIKEQEKKSEKTAHKVFKKISADLDNYKLGNERLIDSGFQEKEDMEIFDLKSFGGQKIEANPYSQNQTPEDSEPSVIEISKPAPQTYVKQDFPDFSQLAAKKNEDDNKQHKPSEENSSSNKPGEDLNLLEPVISQENISSVPVFSPKPQEQIPEFKPQKEIKETPQKPATPASQPAAETKSQVKPDVKISSDSFSNMSEIKIEMPAASKSQVLDIPSMTSRKKKEGPEAEMKPAEPKMPADPQVTQRIEVKNLKQTVTAQGKQTAYSPKKNRFKLYMSLAISLMIIIGGVFFLMDFKKTSKKSNLMTASSQNSNQEKNQREQAVQETQKPQETKEEVSPEIAAAVPQSAADSVSVSGQGVKNAIEAVKNFSLSDGRGTVSNWFSNSFASSGQSREEWTATLLQGKIFVVQYRLIRQKQEPLVYQFEVDSESGKILRGINNNAIDLLESGEEKLKKKAAVSPSQKPKSKPSAIKKKAAEKKDSLLPLPERDESDYSEPTGFENSDMISKAPVKITAPESDEELF